MSGLSMFKIFCAILILITTGLSSNSNASELVHRFSSPSFSKESSGPYWLALHNTELSRKKELQAKIESDLKSKALEVKNSILNKFTTNLQSRIYSQLAQQLTDNLFSGDSDSGSFNLDGNKIDYVKNLDEISLTITDAAGGKTEILIPVASFKF